MAELSVEGEAIRILHIDDEPDHLRFTKIFLEDIDHRFSVASVDTPSELLARLDKDPPDCVVSDYSMPDMNGVELARMVREKCDVPIILYTGKETEDVVEKAFSVGVKFYVRKEVDPGHYHVLARCIGMVVEQRRVERRMRECVEAFRSIVECTHDLIMLTRLDGTIAYLSYGCIEAIGYPPEDLVGKQFELIIHPDDQEKAQTMIQQSLRGRGNSGIEYRIITKSGGVKWVSHSWSTIKIDDKARFVVSAIKDITEHKWMEQEFKEGMERYMTLLEGTLPPTRTEEPPEYEEEPEHSVFDPSELIIKYLKQSRF